MKIKVLFILLIICNNVQSQEAKINSAILSYLVDSKLKKISIKIRIDSARSYFDSNFFLNLPDTIFYQDSQFMALSTTEKEYLSKQFNKKRPFNFDSIDKKMYQIVNMDSIWKLNLNIIDMWNKYKDIYKDDSYYELYNPIYIKNGTYCVFEYAYHCCIHYFERKVVLMKYDQKKWKLVSVLDRVEY